jgi:hypothetical protein
MVDDAEVLLNPRVLVSELYEIRWYAPFKTPNFVYENCRFVVVASLDA